MNASNVIFILNNYIISQNSSSRGSNTPNTFAVLFKGGEFFELYCANFKVFEASYAEINERKVSDIQAYKRHSK